MSVVLLFSDLEPMPQDDGPEPVVRIAYPDAFQATMDIFRRVLVIGEYSERALQLSAEVIDHNAANYTAWQYRRRCLAELHRESAPDVRLAAWRAELVYCQQVCEGNLKNYQVWFHRRACVTELSDPSEELGFVAVVLEDDAKNYHAWGHRQWVLLTFGLWDGELEYVEKLLQDDLRNNSAWNHRYFVVERTSDLSDPAVVEREADYALRYIERAPSNQSPWNYIKGVARKVGFARVPQARAACERHGQAEPACVEALALLVDICLADGAPPDEARDLCVRLKGLDPIRARYWKWRGEQLAA